jgi:hypothetical protein
MTAFELNVIETVPVTSCGNTKARVTAICLFSGDQWTRIERRRRWSQMTFVMSVAESLAALMSPSTATETDD